MDSGSSRAATTGDAVQSFGHALLDLRAKLRALAFERLDFEVLSLLQASAESLRFDNDDLRILAAALREGRRQLEGMREPGKWDAQVDLLVDSVSLIIKDFAVPAKAVNSPPFREFFLAAIEWYVALYNSRHAQRFESMMIALSRLDMGAVPELRERLAVELAGIGRRRPLPAELEDFVHALAERLYLLTPSGALAILSFTLHCRLRDAPRVDVMRDWLPAWLYSLGCRTVRSDRERLLPLRNDAHARLGMMTRWSDILLMRDGGLRSAFLLRWIKLDYSLFLKRRLRKGRPIRSLLPFLGYAARGLNGMLRAPPKRPAPIPARTAKSGLRILDMPCIAGTPYDLLVTRTQGGFGDILTMRPGLIEAARRRRRGRVVFATNRDFFPVFSINDPVDVVDIERTQIDLRSFGQWINLTDCPAARVEVAELPRIRSHRIDIFARAMGVRFPIFSRRRIYPIAFDAAVHKAAEEFVMRHAPTQTRIGIQLRSAESYKDVPALLDAARALATKYAVFIFDSRPIPKQAGDRFVAVDDQPLRNVLAMLPQMHILVTPDSSFMHVAGMAQVPCLALMGSADGKVRCRPYPSVRFLDARKSLACIPCWRNELEKCRLGNGYTSLCLNFLTTPIIVGAVEEMLAGVEATAAARAAGSV